MSRKHRLGALALLLWPACMAAQQSPEISAILARLDRLENENRALTQEVHALRAQLNSSGGAASGPGRETPVEPSSDGSSTTVAMTAEERLDIVERRVEEQSQTKVEAMQRFPIRLT